MKGEGAYAVIVTALLCLIVGAISVYMDWRPWLLTGVLLTVVIGCVIVWAKYSEY